MPGPGPARPSRTVAVPGAAVGPVSRSPWPADAAVESGVAHRSADGSVVFAPPPPAPTAPFLPAGQSRTVLRRAAEDTQAAGSDPPAGGPHPGTVGVLVADPDTPAPPDLSALTDALYERIELRLRSDLMAERERLGCLPDR